MKPRPAGTHPHSADAGRRFVAPTVDERPNTLGPRFRPVACFRLDDSEFAGDSSFIAPRARRDLSILRAMLNERKAERISIFGHAAPVGDEAHSKTLSGRRALAVWALLCREVSTWQDLFENDVEGDTWGAGALEAMFRTVVGADGQPYVPSVLTSVSDDATPGALARFKHDNELDPDDESDVATRAVLFRAYMDHLMGEDDGTTLVLDRGRFLARGVDPKGKGDVQGCSEFNPLLIGSADQVATMARNSALRRRAGPYATNRRVLVLFFPEELEVSSTTWPCPRTDEGHESCVARFWSDAGRRRGPTDERRRFEDTRDTMACRSITAWCTTPHASTREI